LDQRHFTFFKFKIGILIFPLSFLTQCVLIFIYPFICILLFFYFYLFKTNLDFYKSISYIIIPYEKNIATYYNDRLMKQGNHWIVNLCLKKFNVYNAKIDSGDNNDDDDNNIDDDDGGGDDFDFDFDQDKSSVISTSKPSISSFTSSSRSSQHNTQNDSIDHLNTGHDNSIKSDNSGFELIMQENMLSREHVGVREGEESNGDSLRTSSISSRESSIAIPKTLPFSSVGDSV